MKPEQRQQLFNYMDKEHNVILLEGEIDDIERIVNPQPMPFVFGMEPIQSWVDHTFWNRLKLFMENIQCNDLAGQEERDYIYNVANKNVL